MGNAITAVLGKKLGLGSDDAMKEAKLQQLVADAGDLFGEIMENKDAERLNKWFEYIEKHIKGNGFFSDNGDKLSYADFAFWPVVALVEAKKGKQKCEGVIIPQKLTTWKSKMDAVPAIKEMNDSGVALLPDSFL